MEMPRILVISHTPFRSSDSMGSTLGAYFTDYDPENMAQFYIKPINPNMNVCQNYFCVTDDEILKKLINPFKRPIGRAFRLGENAFLESNKAAATGVAGNMAGAHRAVGLIIRNVIWGTGVWNNKKFKNWVKSFDPQIILVQPGDFTYIIKLATKLSKKLEVPLMIHQSEAYYLKRTLETTLLYKLYYRGFRKQFEKMMKRAKHCVYLCDALKRDYDAVFSTPSSVIMKPTALVPEKEQKPFDPQNIRFVYAGNLGLAVGRSTPLLRMGKALKSLGQKIDVYTPSTGKHLSELTEENGIIMHAAVPYSELQEIIRQSDFLVHIESDDEWHKADLKYAFSTKIADMLASGRCAVVYGPAENAGIAYLRDNGLALVVENEAALWSSISGLLENADMREGFVRRALYQAEKHHNPKGNALAMNEIIVNVWRQKL